MSVRRWRPGMSRKQSDQRWMRSAIPNMYDGQSPNPMPLFRTLADQAMMDQSSATAPGSMLKHYAEILKAEGVAPAGTYQTTYYPLPYWPHVVAGGVPQTPGVDYSMDGRTLTIETPMNLHTSEELWIRYDYADAGQGRDPAIPMVYIGFDEDPTPDPVMTIGSILADDFLVMAATGDSDTADSYGTYSFTELITSDPFPGGVHALGWRVASGAETAGADYVADGGLFSRFCGMLIAVRNGALLDSDSIYYGSDTSPNALPVLSGLEDGQMALYVGIGGAGVVSGSIGYAPSPFTSIGNTSAASGKATMACSYYINNTGNTISTPSGNVSSSGSDRKAYLWVLRIGTN